MTKCPECGSDCWRNEVDVEVGIYHDEWKCTNCDWTEDDMFPMTKEDGEKWLNLDGYQMGF